MTLDNRSKIFNEKKSNEKPMASLDWLLYGVLSQFGGGWEPPDRYLGSGGDKPPEDEKLLCIKNASEISSGVYGKSVAALSAINNRVLEELLR